jgi:hypothetical protein
MLSVSRRLSHRFARPGALAVFTACAALAVAGCVTVQATPEIIYVTYPPSTTTPSALATSASTDLLSPSAEASETATAAASAAAPSGAPTVTSETVDKSASDGRWTVTFRKPVVAGASAAAVAAMNASIGARVDGYIGAFQGSRLPAVNPGDGPSTLNGDFAVAFVSATVLSLRFTVQTYVSGAASTSSAPGSLNFDVATGTAIQFVDLFTSTGAALPVLSSQSHSLLSAKLGADLQWPSSVTMAEFQTAWALTAGGLELAWAQGAVATQAAGMPSITIPWSALASVLSNPGPAASFL